MARLMEHVLIPRIGVSVAIHSADARLFNLEVICVHSVKWIILIEHVHPVPKHHVGIHYSSKLLMFTRSMCLQISHNILTGRMTEYTVWLQRDR